MLAYFGYIYLIYNHFPMGISETLYKGQVKLGLIELPSDNRYFRKTSDLITNKCVAKIKSSWNLLQQYQICITIHTSSHMLHASKLRYLLKTCQCPKIGYLSNYCNYLKYETVNYMMWYLHLSPNTTWESKTFTDRLHVSSKCCQKHMKEIYK